MKRFLVLTSALLMSGIAHADDYGCTVLLCLANPAGPTAAEGCAPPIHRLWDDLRHGRGFPSCSMVGADSGTFARLTNETYALCPEGMSIAPAGSLVAEGTVKSGHSLQTVNSWYGQLNNVGNQWDFNITQAETITEAPCNSEYCGWFRNNTNRACVGNNVGIYTRWNGDGSDTIHVYDRVTWLTPNWPARTVDVYIDNRVYQRVFW